MRYTFILLFVVEVLAAPNNRLKIIDGHDAANGEFPYIVSIQLLLDGKWMHNCGGVIISNRWILTNGLCAGGNRDFPYQVYAGMANLKDSAKQSISVEGYVRHPKFDGEADASDFDIGLLKLSSPLEFNDLVQPANLLKENDDVLTGNATLWGWGVTSQSNAADSIYPDILQKIDVPIVDFQECLDTLSQQWYFPMPIYHNSAICTGPLEDEIGAACSGDTGGPLSQDGFVIGLVSWGSPFCESLTVYTKISSYVSWISDNIDEDLYF